MFYASSVWKMSNFTKKIIVQNYAKVVALRYNMMYPVRISSSFARRIAINIEVLASENMRAILW